MYLIPFLAITSRDRTTVKYRHHKRLVRRLIRVHSLLFDYVGARGVIACEWGHGNSFTMWLRCLHVEESFSRSQFNTFQDFQVGTFVPLAGWP